MSIPIEIENTSDADSSVQITETSSGIKMGGPIGVGRGRSSSTHVSQPGNYTATITQSSDPSLIGKKDSCDVQQDPSVNWKIVLDKGGVRFSGVPATLPPS